MNKDSKIYIAGHDGLVGSAIWRNFESKGYKNLVGKSYGELDLIDSSACKQFFEKERPEYVVVAAAKVGGIYANNVYRADFIYQNLMIECNLIHQAYLHGVKKLLFLGSSCIYPRQAPQPMKEEYLLTNILEYTNEPYAIAKIAGLKLCESYNLQYKTDFISVMPTNLYGYYDNFNLETSHVLPALIRKIHLSKHLNLNNWDDVRYDLNKRPIEGVDGNASEEAILEVLRKYGISSEGVEVWGTGKPMREFLFSDDMADACVYVLENVSFEKLISTTPKQTAIGSPNKEIRNTHINLGSGKEHSISDIANLIVKVTECKSKIYFNTEKPDGTMRKLLDTTKLESLGWKYKTELVEGITKVYNWYIK